MIKILLVMEGHTTAVSYYRQITPHSFLAKVYPDDFACSKFLGTHDTKTGLSYMPEIDRITDDELKEFQIVSFLRLVSLKDSRTSTKDKIQRIQRLGIKVVFDIDDYWMLPKTHNYYERSIESETAINTIEALKYADYVTTTTEKLASLILPYNKNVTVIPNCIDPSDQQFTIRNIPSERIRFGWIGGVFHASDIESIKNTFVLLGDWSKNKEIRDKYQVCLGGFGRNSEYLQIESYMTNQYRNLKNEYVEYLKQLTPTAEHISYDQPYRRLWGKDVWSYGDLYNQIDVALAPLVDEPFNNSKSELKILEAGTMKKCVIATDCLPYNTIIQHGVNGLLVKPSRNHHEWYTSIRKLILEPNMREDLAESLHETISDKFDIKIHTETRKELYKKLCE